MKATNNTFNIGPSNIRVIVIIIVMVIVMVMVIVIEWCCTDWTSQNHIVFLLATSRTNSTPNRCLSNLFSDSLQ